VGKICNLGNHSNEGDHGHQGGYVDQYIMDISRPVRLAGAFGGLHVKCPLLLVDFNQTDILCTTVTEIVNITFHNNPFRLSRSLYAD
jgi:hypothetical protein